MRESARKRERARQRERDRERCQASSHEGDEIVYAFQYKILKGFNNSLKKHKEADVSHELQLIFPFNAKIMNQPQS